MNEISYEKEAQSPIDFSSKPSLATEIFARENTATFLTPQDNRADKALKLELPSLFIVYADDEKSKTTQSKASVELEPKGGSGLYKSAKSNRDELNPNELTLIADTSDPAQPMIGQNGIPFFGATENRAPKVTRERSETSNPQSPLSPEEITQWQRTQAQDPRTATEKLSELAKSNSALVRQDVIANPNTPKNVRGKFALEGDISDKTAVASYPGTHKDTLSMFVALNENARVLTAVAKHANADERALANLSKHDNEAVRAAVASNFNVTAEIHNELLRDRSASVSDAARQNPAIYAAEILSGKRGPEDLAEFGSLVRRLSSAEVATLREKLQTAKVELEVEKDGTVLLRTPGKEGPTKDVTLKIPKDGLPYGIVVDTTEPGSFKKLVDRVSPESALRQIRRNRW